MARSYELDTATPDAGGGLGIALYGQVKALFAPWAVAVTGCGAD
ncbi:hypothetical protein [Streptomyces sp. V4I2]|nr:hypothetical protein [Streptomyces sp. V4I2]MDQ1042209.1 hypothetical protein [Streptomyces sp. V4I2]